MERPTKEEQEAASAKSVAYQRFFGALAAFFLFMLVHTYLEHPLYPFQMDNNDWTAAWLITTICDYYVLAFCVSAIIIQTEKSLAVGVFWAFMINAFGSMWLAI